MALVAVRTGSCGNSELSGVGRELGTILGPDGVGGRGKVVS